MNSYFVVPGIIVAIALLVVFFVDIPTATDLALDKNAVIVAGEYEACITPYTEITCQEDLECTLISEKPQRNGLCLKPGTELKEDFINRYAAEQLEKAEEENRIREEALGTPIDVGAITGLD